MADALNGLGEVDSTLADLDAVTAALVSLTEHKDGPNAFGRRLAISHTTRRI